MGSPYVNRELSWLEFNARVLDLASETSVPLLERLKFVAIFGSNLDEFFQVRVGALHDRQEAGVTTRSFDGLTATEQLDRIRARTVRLCAERDLVLGEVLAGLAERGILIVGDAGLNPAQRAALDTYFESRVLPMLTPLAVDPAHPFPYISNLALSVGVMVTDPATGEVIGAAPAASVADVEEAIAAAEQGLRAWRATQAWTRADMLHAIANIMATRSEEAARQITLETGKPLAQARREWGLSLDQFRWHAEEARRIYGHHRKPRPRWPRRNQP